MSLPETLSQPFVRKLTRTLEQLRVPLAAVIFTFGIVTSDLLTPGTSHMSASLKPLSHDTADIFGSFRDDYFEGKYKVGNTTCTVRPVKMAFEVKWARGKGKMMFFFDKRTPDGKFIYASEDKGSGRDRFVFDDDRFTTGQFVRADGKVFPVKKLSGPEAPSGAGRPQQTVDPSRSTIPAAGLRSRRWGRGASTPLTRFKGGFYEI